MAIQNHKAAFFVVLRYLKCPTVVVGADEPTGVLVNVPVAVRAVRVPGLHVTLEVVTTPFLHSLLPTRPSVFLNTLNFSEHILS